MDNIRNHTYGHFQLEEEYEMLDATSLYPFVLSERYYPIGNSSKITSIPADGRLFIIHVNVDQTSFNGVKNKFNYLNFYLPKRYKDKSLDWILPYSNLDTWITSVAYMDLLRMGSTVTPIKDANGYIGLVWKKKALIFTQYVYRFKMIKLEEDKKPKEEQNKARREMGKLCLNAVSGKIIQKRRDTSTQFIQKLKIY